ncbi:hypothetical protein [Staphylospora marina]|uniref:hypothetical protein n=1 Tax=Staphylospora marina TaxID=2490858 RepID=UPI000F5B9EDC|nr:hypothetical protein [Staphylospora marina]
MSRRKEVDVHRLWVTFPYTLLWRLENLADRLESKEGTRLPLNQLIRRATVELLEREGIPQPTEEELAVYLEEVKERSAKYTRKDRRKAE